MKTLKIITLFFALILASNCSQRITDFTIISSKNIDLSRGSEFKRSANRAIGKDLKHIIIFIPTGIPNIKQATDRAIESTPGAIALVDGVINYHWWYFPYVYGRSWYEVEGTPLIDPKLLKDIVR